MRKIKINSVRAGKTVLMENKIWNAAIEKCAKLADGTEQPPIPYNPGDEDAEIVARVREWLNHGAKREQTVETKDLRRICHLAHLHVRGSARSETPEIQLQAWHRVFETTQLSHAHARLQAAEEKAARSAIRTITAAEYKDARDTFCGMGDLTLDVGTKLFDILLKRLRLDHE